MHRTVDVVTVLIRGPILLGPRRVIVSARHIEQLHIHMVSHPHYWTKELRANTCLWSTQYWKKGLAPHLAELGQVRRIVLGHRFKRRHLLQTTHTHTHTHTRTHTLTHFVENSSCQQLRVPLHRGRRWRPPLQHASAARAPTACRIAASTESDDRPTRRSRIRTQENK